MSDLPSSWLVTKIVNILSLNDNGKSFQQGWSPQCERQPAEIDQWGVLKTTAIQQGKFWPHENKNLPVHFEPRTNIEVKNGDILMTCAGPRNRCGVVCFVKETRPKLLMSGKMYRFRPELAVLNPQYLEAFIMSHGAQHAIDKMKTGINDSGLNLTHGRFAELSVPLAPFNEQNHIVAKIETLFSELDKGIEALKTAREQLKVYRQAVLKHAFEGKLTAQWREENKEKLESPEQFLVRIQQERQARYQQQMGGWKTAVKAWEKSGKQDKKPAKPTLPKEADAITPEILYESASLPKEWAWSRLSCLFQTSPQNGLYKSASDYGDGVPIIRIDDFYDGEITNKAGFKRLRANADEVNVYGLSVGDLIINRVNSIEYLGKSALIKLLDKETVFESNIMRCRLVESCVDKNFVVRYLASPTGRKQLCTYAKHAVNQASINQTDVGNALVPLCAVEEQHEVVRILDSKMTVADQLLNEVEVQLKKSETLRQSILKKAFSGQLVPQNPNDEPASTLLERIRAEKATQNPINRGRKSHRNHRRAIR